MNSKEMVSSALSQWINRIETGTHILSTVDFLNCGHSVKDLPVLGEDQKKSLEKLKALRKQVLLTGKI